MYASVITAQAKPGMMSEAINIYTSSIVPAMKKQPGFESANLMVNADTDTAVSTSCWESEAAIAAGEASGYLQRELAKLGTLMAAPPANAHYAVRVQVLQ